MTTASLRASNTAAAAAKTVLITGVSKGLGRALALELSKRGHTVIGCSRTQDKLNALQSELSSPDRHLLLNVDVVRPHSPFHFSVFLKTLPFVLLLLSVLDLQRSNSSIEELARALVEKKVVPDIVGNANCFSLLAYCSNFLFSS